MHMLNINAILNCKTILNICKKQVKCTQFIYDSAKFATILSPCLPPHSLKHYQNTGNFQGLFSRHALCLKSVTRVPNKDIASNMNKKYFSIYKYHFLKLLRFSETNMSFIKNIIS